jgi:hypothetical protein
LEKGKDVCSFRAHPWSLPSHLTRHASDRKGVLPESFPLKSAAARREEYHRAQMGTISGTIAHLGNKKGADRIG